MLNSSNSCPLVDLTADDEDAFAAKRPTRNLSADEIQHLIPIFNSNSSLSLNSEEWIDEVDNVSALNNWNDELTLMYATLRLEDKAMKWFKSNKNISNWREFKYKFVRVFPIQDHRSQYIGDLFKRRKIESETFEEYAYDVAQIAEKCNFDMQTAITYIISGLTDVKMRNRLIAYNCKSIPEVLSRIQTITYNLEQEAKWETPVAQEPNRRVDTPTSSNKLALVTSTSSTPTPTPLMVFDDWKDLVITVNLLEVDVNLSAFVDLASKFTTMQQSEFLKRTFKLEPSKVKLRGFGQGPSKALGKIIQTVVVDKVEMMIEILIVEDEVQRYPMVLGRNFLHNPNVSIVKTFRNLEINYVESPPTSPESNKKKRKSRNRNKKSLLREQEQLEKDQQMDKEVISQLQKEQKTFTVKKEIIFTVREEMNKMSMVNIEKTIATKKPQDAGKQSKKIAERNNNGNVEIDEDQILQILNSIEKDLL